MKNKHRHFIIIEKTDLPIIFARWHETVVGKPRKFMVLTNGTKSKAYGKAAAKYFLELVYSCK